MIEVEKRDCPLFGWEKRGEMEGVDQSLLRPKSVFEEKETQCSALSGG